MAPTANDDKDAQADVPPTEKSGPLSRAFRGVANLARNWRALRTAIKQASANANTPEGEPEDWSHSVLLRAYKSAASQNALLAQELDALILEKDGLAKMTMEDSLTGLGNNRAMSAAYEHEQAVMQRIEAQNKLHPEEPQTKITGGSIVRLDGDKFKGFNSIAYNVGNTVIQTIAARLKREARKMDIAVRVGGDEFDILMHHTTEEQAQQAVYGENGLQARINDGRTSVLVWPIISANGKPAIGKEGKPLFGAAGMIPGEKDGQTTVLYQGERIDSNKFNKPDNCVQLPIQCSVGLAHFGLGDALDVVRANADASQIKNKADRELIRDALAEKIVSPTVKTVLPAPGANAA